MILVKRNLTHSFSCLFLSIEINNFSCMFISIEINIHEKLCVNLAIYKDYSIILIFWPTLVYSSEKVTLILVVILSGFNDTVH